MSESIESIDESKDKLGAFDKLISNVVAYMNQDMSNPKERLKLERALHKYSETNTPDWLLNLIICVTAEREKRA